jgi:hypothetical protein
MSGGLTIKQERFAREYVKHGNGRQAALKAGYSPNCPTEIAHENLSKPQVAEAIRILRQRNAERLDVSREKVINDVAHIAEQSQADGQFAAAIHANALIMKAQGYLVDRHLNMNADVTQQHLDALMQYTDKRVDEAVDRAWRKSVTVVQEPAAPPTFTDQPTQHNVKDRVTDVMTNDVDDCSEDTQT